MLKKITKALAISLYAAALIMALSFQSEAKPKSLSRNVKVGATVYFGKYEQDGNTKNGKEKIEWQVLSSKGNKVLLISKKILDSQPYDREGKDITWEKCTLRKWLNKDFMKAAFSPKEIKKIQNSKIENKGNKKYKTKGGKDTEDKVFLLSINEVKKYFKTDKKRMANITNYGIKRMAEEVEIPEMDLKENFGGNTIMWYWMRSPGDYQDTAAYVEADGSASERGSYVLTAGGGIRPVIVVAFNQSN